MIIEVLRVNAGHVSTRYTVNVPALQIDEFVPKSRPNLQQSQLLAPSSSSISELNSFRVHHT